MSLTKQADLAFYGRVIASVEGTQAWCRLVLYQTQNETYIGYTEKAGHRDAVITTDTNELKEFFGQGVLAKQLYAKANISNTTFID